MDKPERDIRMCQWCMRYDCSEKGGPRKLCLVEQELMPDEITHRYTIKFQKENFDKIERELKK